MGTRIGIKHRIVVNGREYASPHEMPDEVRRAYEAALAKNSELVAIRPGGGIRINGREYDSLDAVPPEDRKFYDLGMAAARDGVIPGTVLAAPASKSAGPKLAPGEVPRSSIGPVKWLIVIGIAALLYLLARALGGVGLRP